MCCTALDCTASDYFGVRDKHGKKEKCKRLGDVMVIKSEAKIDDKKRKREGTPNKEGKDATTKKKKVGTKKHDSESEKSN